MNRREDPLLRQHRSRLLQLAEATNIKPGRGSGKRQRGQRASSQGNALPPSSNGGGRISLRDIVRNDPSYTPNIEHLVFPERKSSNPNLVPAEESRAVNSPPSKVKSLGSNRSRLAEVFSRHYSRGSASQDSSTTSRKNHLNSTSLDSGSVGGHQPVSGPGTRTRRWLSQTAGSSSSSSRQHSTDDVVRGSNVGVGVATGPATATSSSTQAPALPPRRLSPATDAANDHNASIRGQNISILHLRGASDPWEVGSQGSSSYSVSGSIKGQPMGLRKSSSTVNPAPGSQSSSRNNPYTRGTSIPAPAASKRHESLVTSTATISGIKTSHVSRRREPSNLKTTYANDRDRTSSTELFVSGDCNRELSPVRWCDREVDGVYLGRSGWVQVQQRSLDDNRRNYEHPPPEAARGTLPLPRRVTVKLADYHCSNSEPGRYSSQDFSTCRPDYLALHHQEYDQPAYDEESSSPPPPPPPPESFSPPPSLTPIISPPPAFQDANKRSRHSRMLYPGKAPFLPRSKAIDSDIITPPPSPPPAPASKMTWSGSLPLTKKLPKTMSARKSLQSHRMAQAKSLEDQTCSNSNTSSNRRTQFAQRYIESSSSSSSSMGFRSLDSCVSRGSAMPRLKETTDSSVEGYEDGDEEDDHAAAMLLNHFTVNSSTESIRVNGERVSPSTSKQPNRRLIRRSPGSSESGKPSLSFDSSSDDSSTSAERPGRSPTGVFKRTSAGRSHQRTSSPPDSLQSRVRRSRSLQLPEKRSPGSQRDGESSTTHRLVVKIGDRKRHLLNRKAQSTEDALNEDLLREAEAVKEFLYGSQGGRGRSTVTTGGGRYEENRERRNAYDVYFISSKQGQAKATQQNRRPRTLQRGATTPNNAVPDFGLSSPDAKRCNSSTCDFWPHCSQRETLYSPNQGPVFMKLSQSYPAHQRVNENPVQRNSASSSPASLERMDAESHKNRKEPQPGQTSSKPPKGVLKPSGNSVSGKWTEGIVYRKSEFERRVSPVQGKQMVRSPNAVAASSSTITSSSSSSDIWITTSDRTVTKSPKNLKSSGASTPMEDAIIGSLKTLMEPPKDGILSRPGSAPTRGEDSLTVDATLDPHQRSLSLPKSFLTHNTAVGNPSYSATTSWRKSQTETSQRSSPSPNYSGPSQEMATTPHTAPVSPLHEKYNPSGSSLGSDRRRIATSALSKAQRRIKASSTPALLDSRDHDGRQWSSVEPDDRRTQMATEHPLAEASIPLVSRQHEVTGNPNSASGGTNSSAGTGTGIGAGTGTGSHNRMGQESVLQKFRKSFSLRFHKKGSKESTDGEGHPEGHRLEDEEVELEVEEDEDDEEREPPPPPAPASAAEQLAAKEEQNDQRFRFGPLVWRSSKERKKGSKAARNAKCNSGDSGIQIEMVSGGALTGVIGSSGVMGAGDSSESHDTDAPDDVDSPPTLRRHLADKSRPQSELINQILIDKFKADLQSRASRHQHVRRTNSDLGGQRLLQWDTRSGYSQLHNYRRMLSTPSPIKTRPPRLSPRHSSHDIVTLRSNAKGRSSRTNLRRSLSQPLGINQLSPLMRTKTAVTGTRIPGGTVVFSEDEQDGRIGGGVTTSDDDTMSDSESSVASLTDRKKFEQILDDECVVLAEALWDHIAMEPEELAFRAGDVIDVMDTLDKDWWWGSCRGEHGWFPAAFVRLRVSQEDTVEDCLAAMAAGTSSSMQLRRRTSVSFLSNEQVRTSVVRELVQTERDFVKVLRDVAEGYVAECRRRADMFTEEQIETIFINLEDLLDFQSEFLKDLEARIDWAAPYKSCVGECFLKHRSGFRMYSEYCNSHPMATATLQELYQHNRYSKFFEACRLMRGLIEIPLDGYLLTPVQRICKYPLQLAELLKYTKTDHPDFQKIQEALDAMRGVAVLINERKRRMESLEKLAAWQLRVEGWEGEDLIEVSSQLIYQGEVIRVTTGMWTNNVTLFLFDHQLVYCKKDILKRNTYVYKGRIYLDTSEVIDVPDGKDHQLGVTVRHCLKVYSCVRDKWLLFCCRTAEEKRRWLQAMAEERRLVLQDRNDGLEFPAAARQLARLAATRQAINRPPIKPRAKTYKHESAYESPTMSQSGTNSLGRKVGTWFTFGSSKKQSMKPQTS